MMERLFTDKQYDSYKVSEPFSVLYGIAGRRTMLCKNTLRILYEFAISVKTIKGDIAEAGVWEGGSTYILASVLKNKKVHAFDSWEGLPEPTAPDLVDLDEQPMIKGWGKCDPPVEFLAKFGNQVILHHGLFRDTLVNISDRLFCFVHIDCDQYLSVKQCLEFFYPRMVDGGIIIIDDYGFFLTPGATKATDDFFVDKLDEALFVVSGGLYIRRKFCLGKL